MAGHLCLLPTSLHSRLSYPTSCSAIARSEGGLSDALPHVVSLHLSWSMEVLAWASGRLRSDDAVDPGLLVVSNELSLDGGGLAMPCWCSSSWLVIWLVILWRPPALPGLQQPFEQLWGI